MSRQEVEQVDGEQQWRSWKSNVPMIYDWFTNHRLVWPSQACRWGPSVEEAKDFVKYCIYYSEQTDGTEPNKLRQCVMTVGKPRGQRNESHMASWEHEKRSPYIKLTKSINHPGEVNKIREVPGTPILITHTDSPELYVWNMVMQAHRKGINESISEVILDGHEDIAQYALGTTTAGPYVASGGSDKNVLLWNLEDVQSRITRQDCQVLTASTRLMNRQKLTGHSSNIEDLCFRPGTDNEIVSVGDDKCMMLWDTRQGKAPSQKVKYAHGEEDVHCVDWCSVDHNFIASGCADGSVRVWDVRSLSSNQGQPVHTLSFHKAATMKVEWHPTQKGFLGSAGEDARFLLWNIHKTSPDEGVQLPKDCPPQLIFQHVGHRTTVVDFQWNVLDEFLVISVSDETQLEDAGGTLQVWRINDLAYKPFDEVVSILERHRQIILEEDSVPVSLN